MNQETPGQNADQNDNSINYRSLRQFVGFIGIFLPIVLLLGNLISHQIESSSCAILPGSISGYYYTPMRGVFVGMLCALGVFLVAYKGSNIWDRWITDIAGGLAIVVALCPTKPVVVNPPKGCGSVAHLSLVQNVVGDVHLSAASCLFILLAWMSLRFANRLPKQAQRPAEKWGSMSDRLFIVCGIAILLCVLGAVLANFFVKSSLPVLFTFEGIAVIAFGVSWLVKGLIADPTNRLYARVAGRWRGAGAGP